MVRSCSKSQGEKDIEAAAPNLSALPVHGEMLYQIASGVLYQIDLLAHPWPKLGGGDVGGHFLPRPGHALRIRRCPPARRHLTVAYVESPFAMGHLLCVCRLRLRTC